MALRIQSRVVAQIIGLDHQIVFVLLVWKDIDVNILGDHHQSAGIVLKPS